MDYYSQLVNDGVPGPCVSGEVLMNKSGDLDAVDIQDLYNSGTIYYEPQHIPRPVPQPQPRQDPEPVPPKKHKKKKSESSWDIKIGGILVSIVLMILLIGYLSNEPTVPMSAK